MMLLFGLKKHDNIEEILNCLLAHPELLRKMKINARLLAKKNSTKDICKILLGKPSKVCQ